MTSSLSSGSSALASGLHGAPSSTTAQGGGQTAGEVSLLLGAADNVFKQEGETAYLASKRNIKQRLVAFYMYHPEDRSKGRHSHTVGCLITMSLKQHMPGMQRSFLSTVE
ncbi:uncharacterized protein [Zea mays]|uniref:Uncharacterized protein n=1 Tax=Zea mays TaxID=4577 RepID=A0A804Q388_MAIZE|nr:uncharacterized protein LOC100278010 isoform X2 [Zea mays]|eukprot:XP_020395276.1 uncharacterized protein LOC100278010 isoform X2 [Zea mays]